MEVRPLGFLLTEINIRFIYLTVFTVNLHTRKSKYARFKVLKKYFIHLIYQRWKTSFAFYFNTYNNEKLLQINE